MPNHPLTGVIVKLRNADEHLQRLHAATRAYLDSGTKPAGVVAEQDPSDRTRGYLRFKVFSEPPLEIAVIAGDVIHNLRCSMDYIIEELVKRNGKKPGSSNQFPICTTPDGFADALRRGRLNGVSKTGIAAVKQHQPFEGTAKGSARPPLLLLLQLSNYDKHHMLAICALNASLVWSFVNRDGLVLRSDRTTEPVRDGGVLAEMPANMVINGEKTQLQAQITISIGFNEPALSPFEVFETLQVIREFIGKVIVPAFEPFFQPLPDDLRLTTHGVALPKYPNGLLLIRSSGDGAEATGS
jgi:hypothetical protein